MAQPAGSENVPNATQQADEKPTTTATTTPSTAHQTDSLVDAIAVAVAEPICQAISIDAGVACSDSNGNGNVGDATTSTTTPSMPSIDATTPAATAEPINAEANIASIDATDVGTSADGPLVVDEEASIEPANAAATQPVFANSMTAETEPATTVSTSSPSLTSLRENFAAEGFTLLGSAGRDVEGAAAAAAADVTVAGTVASAAEHRSISLARSADKLPSTKNTTTTPTPTSLEPSANNRYPTPPPSAMPFNQQHHATGEQKDGRARARK